MKQRFIVIFAVLSSFAVLLPHESECLVGLKSIVHWGAKGVASGVKTSAVIGKKVAAGAKSSLVVPIIGAKKALLLAPIAIPIAIGTIQSWILFFHYLN